MRGEVSEKLTDSRCGTPRPSPFQGRLGTGACAKTTVRSVEKSYFILLTKSVDFVIMDSITRRKMIQDELETP